MREFWQRLSDPRHPLMHAPFFTRHFLRLDMMHCLDCNGVVAIIAAEVFVYSIKELAVLGPTEEARLERLNQMMVGFYGRNNVQHRIGDGLSKSHLFSGNVGDSFPTLHGPHIKAANTRALLPFLAEIVSAPYFVLLGQRERSMKQVVLCLDEFVRILYDGDIFVGRRC